jgi:Uma2 family endonuclease
MTTALQPMTLPVEQRLLLHDVDWTTYERLLDDLEGHHLRLNYDRGQLEIMTTSSEHERWKKLLARFFEALTEELNLPILGVGNFTVRRKDLNRGLEPDECWYIAHEPDVRESEQIDLNIDPPPDLVVEIEVSRSAIDRLELFAALGIPELWRFDGRRLSVLVLGAEGRYGESGHSPTFPSIPLSGFAEYLGRRGQTDETTLVKSFRNWVRGVVAG